MSEPARRRVLFAWELGGGTGHIYRLLPLADGLAAAGHDVVMAVRDVPTTRRILAARPYEVVQAPILTTLPFLEIPLVSWADLLLASGYTSTDVMRWLLRAWLSIFEREAPDLLVTDFAPAAMLAARIAGLQVVSVGNGWSLPPREVPLPSIQPWSEISPAVLAEAETRALGPINAAVTGLGGRPLQALAELFRGTNEYLCCFPELDHYARRGEADYYGAIYETEAGAVPEWPTATGPRVFVYMTTSDAGSRATIGALATLGWPAAIYAPNQILSPIPSSIWVAPGPVSLSALFTARPIVVCSGLNLTSAALVAGCPVLIIPNHQEQMMLAHRVAAQGLGLLVPPGADSELIAAMLRMLHEHAGIAARATAFEASYRGYRPSLAVQAIAEDAIRLLGR